MDSRTPGRRPLFKNLGAVIAILLVLVVLSYAIVAFFNPHVAELPPHHPFVWGVYSGDADGVAALEASVGKTPNIAATFVGFTEEFPQDFVDAISSSTTPLIFLETPGGSTLKDVVSGTYDANLRVFAAAAKAYGKPLILVPFNEPNLNEAPWGFSASPENTASNFKAAWARVHNIFATAPNVKFGIAYNNVSIPEDPQNTFESLYPGDAQVDYVGIDGFNWQEDGNWQTFADTIGSTTLELEQFHKPIYLFSIGTGEDTAGDPNLKAQWIRDMYTWLDAHTEVSGFIWFNENKSSQGEKNWLIDSNPQAFEAFKAGLNQQ